MSFIPLNGPGFQGLKAGDRVKFWIYGGIGTGGKAARVQRVARVQGLLVFEDHVVVNMGGKYGMPYVVDSSNYIGRA